MEEKDTKAETPQVNPGYALFQIAKALATSEEHDQEVSEAVRTVLRRRWRQAKGLEDRTSWRDRDWSWW